MVCPVLVVAVVLLPRQLLVVAVCPVLVVVVVLLPCHQLPEVAACQLPEVVDRLFPEVVDRLLQTGKRLVRLTPADGRKSPGEDTKLPEQVGRVASSGEFQREQRGHTARMRRQT